MLLLDIIVSKDGIKVNTVADMMKVFVDYYKDLYMSQVLIQGKVDEFLNQIELPSLTEVHMLKLQGPLQLKKLIGQLLD